MEGIFDEDVEIEQLIIENEALEEEIESFIIRCDNCGSDIMGIDTSNGCPVCEHGKTCPDCNEEINFEYGLCGCPTECPACNMPIGMCGCKGMAELEEFEVYGRV